MRTSTAEYASKSFWFSFRLLAGRVLSFKQAYTWIPPKQFACLVGALLSDVLVSDAQPNSYFTFFEGLTNN
jgi:hypothetical protein